MNEARGAPLRASLARRRAEEWALVLLAEGLSPTVHATDEGFAVCVPAAEAQRGATLLSDYELELRKDLPSEPEPEPTRATWPTAVLFPAALLAFYWITGPRDETVAWFMVGSADAERIVSGETWRVVTALTLHADLGHVAGNGIVGAVFLAGLSRILGAGAAGAGVLMAGASGNLVNAFIRGGDHILVGASTAVFGALGLLAGLGVVRRRDAGTRGRRTWVPFAAGLGLVAMLGMGARSDIWAHLFGFLSGSVLGVCTGFVPLGRSPRFVQWLLGGGTLAVLVGCWILALG